MAADPNGPSEEPLEADLGTVTDEQWLAGHEALVALAEGSDFPVEELSFIWDPDLLPSTLIAPGEVDHGPVWTDATILPVNPPEAPHGRP